MDCTHCGGNHANIWPSVYSRLKIEPRMNHDTSTNHYTCLFFLHQHRVISVILVLRVIQGMGLFTRVARAIRQSPNKGQVIIKSWYCQNYLNTLFRAYMCLLMNSNIKSQCTSKYSYKMVLGRHNPLPTSLGDAPFAINSPLPLQSIHTQASPARYKSRNVCRRNPPPQYMRISAPPKAHKLSRQNQQPGQS